MAVAYESDGGTVWAAVASNAAISVPLPATRPVGSILLLVAFNRLITASVTTAPTGYTLLTGFPVAGGGASQGKMWVYGRIVDGTESAPTIAMDGATGTTGDIWGACIYCYSGSRTVIGTALVDSFASSSQASATTTNTFPAATAKSPGAMVIRTLARFRDAADTFTPTATWNEREDASSTNRTGGQHFLQDKPATASGSQAAVTVAPSNTTAANYLSVTLILNFPPIIDLEAYRFRNDDGDETAATWRQPVNTPDTVALDTPFRIRFALANGAGGGNLSGSQRIQFRLKPSGGSFGAWTNVSAATPAAPALSPHYANLTATTQQISAGTFDAGWMIEGDFLATSVDFPITQHSEFEFLLTASSANGAATGDTYEFRLIEFTGSFAYATYTQTPSLTIGVAGTNWTQPVDDTLTLADAMASQAVFARTVTDPVALTDGQAFQRDVALPLADSLALADLVAAQRGIAQAVADTLALADLASTAAGKAATLADTLALADAATSQAAFARALADTLTLADTLAAQSAFQLSIADTLTLADSLASQAAFVRAIADTLTLADLVDPVKTIGGVDHTQPIADTLALLDALALGRGLTVTDTLAVADSLSSQAAYLRDIADTLSLVDTVVTAEAGVQQIADTLALADALRFDRTLTLADSLALADALTAGSTLARSVADTLAVADILTAQKAILRDLADTVSLSDAFRFGRDLGLTDTVTLADAVSFQAAYLRTLADTVSLADAATAGLQLTRVLADTVTLLDSLAATLGRAVTLEDALALTDLLTLIQTTPIGGPPLADGHFNFTGRGRITQSATGEYTGRGHRGRLTTSSSRSLAQTTKGTSS